MLKSSSIRFSSKTAAKAHLDHCKVASDIARFICASSQPTKTVLITGAGCSTASGIPDYRSATGMYNRPGFKPLQYADFKGSEFFQKKYWIRSMFGYNDLLEAQCNGVHLGLASLQLKAKVGPIVTQNVDGLHHLSFHHLSSLQGDASSASSSSQYSAGINMNHQKKRQSDGAVHELHGNLQTAICLSCQDQIDRYHYQQRLVAANRSLVKQYSPKSDAVRADGDYDVPESLIDSFHLIKCRACDGFMRPGVVMFGDSVPRPLVDSVFDMVDQADRILCLGTSLQVFSAYRFVLRAAERGIPIGIVNNGPTRADTLSEKEEPRMKLPIGQTMRLAPVIQRFQVDDLAAVIPLVSGIL